jgi:hypothetical protein
MGLREKDFDAVALNRIKQAFAEKDAPYIGRHLAENYSQTVKEAAARALRALCGNKDPS